MIRPGLASLGASILVLGSALSPRPAVAHVAPGAFAMLEPSKASRVGVLPVQVQGDLPASTAEQMRTILVDNLAADGVEVLDVEAVEQALASAGPCDDPECRAGLAAKLGADYLLVALVEGDEDEFSTTVILVDAKSGEEVAPFTGECTICGFVEVRDMMRMRALDARAEVIGRAGAETPAPAPVVTGPVDAPPPPSKRVPAGWALVGAGATAALGGIVLLALHKRSAGCQDNPRGGECIPLRYTTAPVGGAVLGAGILAAAGGAVLLVLDRKKSAPPRSQVSLTPRGVAWRLRF